MVEARAEILPGYTRVTTVTDFFQEPDLVEWKLKKGAEAKKLSKQAMKIGSEVDAAIKQFVLTGSYGKVKTVEAASCLDGFKRWHEDYKPDLTLGVRFYNDEYMITGEPDLILDGRIIDIKCSRSVYPKYHLQTAAYSYPTNTFKTAILRLHKGLSDYEYVCHDNDEVLDDQLAFFGLLTAFKRVQLLAGKGDCNADNITNDEIGNQF